MHLDYANFIQRMGSFDMDLSDDDELSHYGVLGMKWGHHKRQETVSQRFEKTIFSIGAKLNPREMEYKLRKITNKADSDVKFTADAVRKLSGDSGVLPSNKTALKAVESVGITKHAGVKYDNLSASDIEKFKTYTDSARYSRGINGYLAIGTPEEYARHATELKDSLRKNNVNDLTVYRSCNLKFSVDGIARKADQVGEEELQSMVDKVSKNFNGKKISENRVWSTSTSPLFAIDTWRAVNPTAAKTYNTYMIINCKNTPGVLADASTSKGKSLVNTRSNQEAILAPNKLTYRKVAYDEERQMFAITVDAE